MTEKIDGKPHDLRRKRMANGGYDSLYPESWFYNDDKGITVVVGGNLAHLPWSTIERAARRVGRKLRTPAAPRETR